MRVGRPYQAALHCTVMDWFVTERSVHEISNLVECVAVQARPFIIKAGGEEDFGTPDNPLLVNVLENNEDLWALHNALHSELAKLKVSYVHPQYIGKGWRPHVTTQHKTRSLHEGQSHKILALYLILAKGNIEHGDKIVQARLALCDETAA